MEEGGKFPLGSCGEIMLKGWGVEKYVASRDSIFSKLIMHVRSQNRQMFVDHHTMHMVNNL